MEDIYKSMLNYIYQRNYLKNIIIFINEYFPYIMYILYPTIIIYLFIINSSLLLTTIIKPLSAFLIVTIIRKMINRPRPYETMDIQSLISHKSGQSFPSRHTVSAFIIALVCYNVHPILGIVALMIAAIISLSRIFAGVHYISDVIVSVFIAFFIYLLKIF